MVDRKGFLRLNDDYMGIIIFLYIHSELKNKIKWNYTQQKFQGIL